MLRRTPLLFVLALSWAGCLGHQRLEQVEHLSEDGKELYAKYKQFMTEGQQDEFLNQPTDEDRRSYVAGLKVEQRLARYPKFIQDAIWSQEAVAGMDREALLLTWGTPDLREWDEQQLAKGNEVERWTYRRNDQYVQAVVTNGVVTAVERPESKP